MNTMKFQIYSVNNKKLTKEEAIQQMKLIKINQIWILIDKMKKNKRNKMIKIKAKNNIKTNKK